MSVSASPRARIAIVTKDELFGRSLAAWLVENDPDFPGVVTVSRWGDLLNAPDFPTELVLLDAESSTRVSIESRVRTLRTSGTAVIVLRPACGDPLQRAVSAGAFCVLEKTVPFGLIREIARAAVGLPLDHPPD